MIAAAAHVHYPAQTLAGGLIFLLIFAGVFIALPAWILTRGD